LEDPVSVRRFATALCGALLATIALAGPAYAEKWSIKDPAHDVFGSCEDHECSPEVDPSRTYGDMLTTWATHGTTYLTVKTEFADLGKPNKSAVWAFSLKTDEDKIYKLQVWMDDDGASITFLVRKGDAVSCENLSTTINYGDEKIQVKIPRSCLSKPTKVKLGNLFYSRTTNADGLDFYSDYTINPGVWDSWIKRDY
jgi:hypothetical protein